jgi:hypothetical protein
MRAISGVALIYPRTGGATQRILAVVSAPSNLLSELVHPARAALATLALASPFQNLVANVAFT